MPITSPIQWFFYSCLWKTASSLSHTPVHINSRGGSVGWMFVARRSHDIDVIAICSCLLYFSTTCTCYQLLVVLGREGFVVKINISSSWCAITSIQLQKLSKKPAASPVGWAKKGIKPYQTKTTATKWTALKWISAKMLTIFFWFDTWSNICIRGRRLYYTYVYIILEY